MYIFFDDGLVFMVDMQLYLFLFYRLERKCGKVILKFQCCMGLSLLLFEFIRFDFNNVKIFEILYCLELMGYNFR